MSRCLIAQAHRALSQAAAFRFALRSARHAGIDPAGLLAGWETCMQEARRYRLVATNLLRFARPRVLNHRAIRAFQALRESSERLWRAKHGEAADALFDGGGEWSRAYWSGQLERLERSLAGEVARRYGMTAAELIDQRDAAQAEEERMHRTCEELL